MTIALVRDELARFLRAENPGVICLAGAWGVGKTHLWRDILLQTQPHASTPRYAYVSLFGLNSLDDVKRAIFENSVNVAERAYSPTLAGLQAFVDSVEGFTRKASRIGNLFISQQFADLSSAFFLTIRNQIVCFDDLERHGDELAVGDVLGLASFLKEERNCRVIIILNDEMLGDGRDEFDRYLEKVSDRLVRLAPTPQEAADIALGAQDRLTRLLAENTVKLGISNIRTIRRTREFAERVAPILDGLREEVLAQAVQTLAVVCWSVLEPDIAPSPKFLRERRHLDVFGGRDENVGPDEARWNALLDSYSKFWHLDELDVALLDGVQTGFFDQARIRSLAEGNHNALEQGGLKERWREAWFVFHSSFKGEEADVLGRIREAFLEARSILTPSDVSSTLRLFKDFDRRDEALQLLEAYIASVQDRDFKFFDLGEYHFFSEPPDDDLRAAFDELYSRKKPPRAVEDALMLIGEGRGWNLEDEEIVKRTTEDELYDLLKDAEGQRFADIMAGATHWWRVAGLSPEIAAFNERVRSVLTRIAGESRLNAQRLQRFGIRPAEVNGDDAEAGGGEAPPA